MLTALVLVCSLTATPDLSDCDQKNAIDVLRVAHVLADELVVGAVCQHLAVELIDDDVKIPIAELAALLGDLGVGLVRPFGLDERNGFPDHRGGFILVGAVCGTGDAALERKCTPHGRSHSLPQQQPAAKQPSLPIECPSEMPGANVSIACQRRNW